MKHKWIKTEKIKDYAQIVVSHLCGMEEVDMIFVLIVES